MKPSFQYETKLFVVHFGTDESPIDVYAMDHADLWATLKEQNAQSGCTGHHPH
jgi:hypothetical protein